MMSPASRRHGRIGARLLTWVTVHANRLQLGETYNAGTGFLIRQNPDTVRVPDVAFVSRDRLVTYPEDIGYLPLAPDFIAEVVSPSDRRSGVEAKVQAWLDAGVRVVLVVEPATSLVREYRAGSEARVHADGFIDLDDVLPGFQLDVAELFA